MGGTIIIADIAECMQAFSGVLTCYIFHVAAHGATLLCCTNSLTPVRLCIARVLVGAAPCEAISKLFRKLMHRSENVAGA